MPRAKKTLSGAPGAGAVAPVDVPYGEGERAIESQRRMPVPDFARSGGSVPATGGTDGGGGAAGGGQPTDRFAAAIAAAQQMAPPEGLMQAPTQRPLEPLQAGMAPGELTGGPQFSEALFDLRALAQANPEYRGLLRLIALGEEQV